jgi:hypothetical protein
MKESLGKWRFLLVSAPSLVFLLYLEGFFDVQWTTVAHVVISFQGPRRALRALS